MIKSVIKIALGVALALTLDRWIEERRKRWNPSAVIGRGLDTANHRLEQKRARKAAAAGRAGGNS
jgi:cobalamin biosynthesis protein CobD/CbiB